MKKLIIALMLSLTFCNLVEAKTHTIVKGDTLWDISQSNYGDPTLWNTIAEVNGVANPNSIPIGTVLVIPDKDIMNKIKNETDSKKKEELIQQAGGKTTEDAGTKTDTGTKTNTSTSTDSGKTKIVVYTSPKESDTELKNILDKEVDQKFMITVPSKIVETDSY